MRRSCVLALAGLAAVVPAAASADTQKVMMEGSLFAPPRISVLVGDTVAWHNMSFRDHTVTADDGSFGSSAHIGPNGGYSFTFPSAGAHPYHCQLHPFMTGAVDVYPLLLEGPSSAVNRGGTLTLRGRAAAGSGSVSIEEDSGAGFAQVATAAIAGSGAFHVSLPAGVSARYRAVSPAGASPAVQVVVADRRLRVSAARHGHRALVRVSAVPRAPGAIVMLEVWRRERFGWWPMARHRLDRHSRTAFRAPLGARARAVLTLGDGWTPVVTSAALRLPRR